MKNTFYPFKITLGALSLIVLTTMFILESCKKQPNSVRNQNSNGSSSSWLSSPVNSTIAGYVYLEDGSPAVNAKVTVGEKITTTNSEGYFSSGLTRVPQRHAFVKVELNGYFLGMRTLYVQENATEFVRIRLMKEEEAGNFNATNGGEIQALGGGRIIFSSNSIVEEVSGKSYSGNVHVFAKRINPIGEHLAELMPGALRGINSDGVEQALISYGMMAVELKADDGSPLQLAGGKEAELRLPVEAEQSNVAPQTVPMWWMNEEIGMWQEEGAFEQSAGEYVGKVKHFSFWNCDDGFSIINYTVRIHDSISNNPLVNYRVKINVSNALSASAFTNSLGQVSGGIPINTNCNVEVMYSCNQNWVVTKSWNLISGTNAIDDGFKKVFVSNAVDYSTIIGSVLGCNGNVLPGAYVRIYQNGTPNLILADANGNFTYTVPSCGTQINYEVTAIDSASGKCSQSLKVSLGQGIHQLGVFDACVLQGEYLRVTQQYNGTVTKYSIPMINSNLTCYRQGNFLHFNAASFNQPLSFNGMIWGDENTTSAHTLTSYNENTPSTLAGANFVISSPVYFTHYGGSLDYVEGGFKVIFSPPFSDLTMGFEFRLKRTN